MALETYAGSFILDASILLGEGDTLAVTGVGFQPKLVFFWSVGDPEDLLNFTNSAFSIGFSDGVNGRSYSQRSSASNDDPALAVARRRISPTALIMTLGGGSVDWRFDIDSMDADGFTIIIPPDNPGQSGSNDPDNDDIVYFLALGGDDLIETAIGSFNTLAEPGQQTVDGLGLTGFPDFLMLLGADTPVDIDDWEPVDSAGEVGNGPEDTVLSLGMATPLNQVGVSIRAASGVPITQTYDTMREDIVTVFKPESSAFLQNAELLSFSDDSFRLRWLKAAPRRMFYLALRGPKVKVGVSSTPMVPTKKPIPGLQLLPKMFLGLCASLAPSLPSGTEGMGFSFGGGTEEFQRCIAVNDASARLPSAPRRYVEDAAVRIHSPSGQPRALGRIHEFNTGDVVLDWLISDPPSIQFTYVTMGDAAGPVGETIVHDNVTELTGPGASIDETIQLGSLVWVNVAAEGHRLILGESDVLGDSSNVLVRLSADVANQTLVLNFTDVEFDKGLQITEMDSGTVLIYVGGVIVDVINIQEGGANVTNTPHNTLDFEDDVFNVQDNGDGSATVDIDESGINHNLLLNAAGDNHVAHSLVVLTAGTGLTGGGDITVSRVFNVVGVNSIVANADDIQLVNDVASPGANRVYGTDGSGVKGWQSTLFGSGYASAERTTLINNTTATFVEALNLNTGTIGAGVYRIGWYFVWGQTNTGNVFQVQVQVDNTTNLIDPANGGKYDKQPNSGQAARREIVSGMRFLALSAGSHNIDLDFNASGGTSTIYHAVLSIWRVA